MEAIIQTGGKQYKVKKGQKLSIGKIKAETDAEVSFAALMTIVGEQSTLGKGKVSAKVIRQFKGPKVTAATYKRRKGFHRKKGFRPQLTEIEINDIQA